jgi:hypothetical protein
MADDESHQRSHPESPADRREREIIRTERSILARLARAIKVADLMAILMVLATFFSAYATWRTALVTTAIFAVADRPFLGVERVSFQVTDPARPMIIVNYKNFGNIPALETIVSVHAVVDGKMVRPVADAMSEIDAGIVSPNVPHYFYIALPADKYQAAIAGKSNLQVHVSVVYKGPARGTELCYFERFAYEPRLNIFQASGGDDRCGTEIF